METVHAARDEHVTPKSVHGPLHDRGIGNAIRAFRSFRDTAHDDDRSTVGCEFEFEGIGRETGATLEPPPQLTSAPSASADTSRRSRVDGRHFYERAVAAIEQNTVVRPKALHLDG